MKQNLTLNLSIDFSNMVGDNLLGAMSVLGASDESDMLIKYSEMLVAKLESAIKAHHNVEISSANITPIHENEGEESLMDNMLSESITHEEYESIEENNSDTELIRAMTDSLFEINSTLGEIDTLIVANDYVKELFINEFYTVFSEDNTIVRDDLLNELGVYYTIRYKDINGSIKESGGI